MVAVLAGDGRAAGARPGAPKALSVSDPDVAAGLRRDRARRDRLEGADAKAERVRSRTRYRDVTGAEALDVGREAFAEEFSGRLFEGREPSRGLRLVRSLGAHAGVVQDGEGRRLVAQSSLPLEVPNAAGDSEPVDLSLTERASSFDSVNAMVALRISRRLRGGVSFGRGKFAVTPAGDTDVSDTKTSDRVFFAGAQRDTDVVFAPRAGGAEIAWQLRSSANPEALVLDVDLPAGALLRRGQDRRSDSR